MVGEGVLTECLSSDRIEKILLVSRKSYGHGSARLSEILLPDFFDLSERHHGIQKGTFLDIGANIGTTSIQAAEFSNVSAVISFEPSSDNYALLMANVYLNKLEKKLLHLNVPLAKRTLRIG